MKIKVWIKSLERNGFHAEYGTLISSDETHSVIKLESGETIREKNFRVEEQNET